MVLEKTLESPLDCKEFQPVQSVDQPWDFFGRNDAKAETLILWPPHAKVGGHRAYLPECGSHTDRGDMENTLVPTSSELSLQIGLNH